MYAIDDIEVPSLEDDLEYRNEFKVIIKNLGISRYKSFVESYNKSLERELKAGTLLTPSQIINDELNKTL